MRTSRFIIVLLGLGPACGATPADAEQAAGANLARLRQTPQYRQIVIGGAYKSGGWMVEPCRDAEASLGDRLSVVAGPVVVDGEMRPQSGSWIEHVFVGGCATLRQLNVMVTVQRPDQLATVPTLPGTTRADPVLQKDGTAYAFVAAGIDPKGCKPIYFLDTAYLGPIGEQPLVPGKPGWSERWTIGQCDRRVTIEMRFMPDATGTTIKARKAAAPAASP